MGWDSGFGWRLLALWAVDFAWEGRFEGMLDKVLQINA